jgi:hypothetical protein
VLITAPPRRTFATATISASQDFPPISSTSALPSQVDLNFCPPHGTASSSDIVTSPTLDIPVFTTDSQSKWLPSSSPSLPASSARPTLPEQPSHQDFVLFDLPQQHNNPRQRREILTSALGHPYRHQSYQHQQQQHSDHISPVSQSHRSTPASGRLPSLTSVRRQSYPRRHSHLPTSLSSTSTVNGQAARPRRPPVPLFPHSVPSVPRTANAKMNIQGMCNRNLSLIQHGLIRLHRS